VVRGLPESNLADRVPVSRYRNNSRGQKAALGEQASPPRVPHVRARAASRL